MPLVVADTGPLYYLVPTGDIELLPKLFERVLVPQVVRDELANAEALQAVGDWIARAPGWLDVRPAHPGADDVAVAKLDDGERAAIALALAVKAEWCSWTIAKVSASPAAAALLSPARWACSILRPAAA